MIDGLKKVGLAFLSMMMFGFVIIIITIPFNIMSDTNNEGEISQKYSEKGLYFGPKHYVKLDNGSISKVSKKEIYELEIGDTYTITKTDSMKSALFAGSILFPFALFILWLDWLIISSIYYETKFIQWIEKKQKNHERKLTKIGKFIVEIIIVLFIMTTFVVTPFIGKNLFHKIVPIGKQETNAVVLEKEKDVSSVGKYGVKVTNTLTLYYIDQSGYSYQTKKDVSSSTYDRYDEETLIPITYRAKNPYDTFVTSKSLSGLLSVLLRIDTMAILVFIYLNYFFIKRYVKKIKKMKENLT